MTARDIAAVHGTMRAISHLDDAALSSLGLGRIQRQGLLPEIKALRVPSWGAQPQLSLKRRIESGWSGFWAFPVCAPAWVLTTELD